MAEMLPEEVVTVIVLVEDKEDTYHQVSMSNKQLHDICKVLSVTKIGYKFNLHPGVFSIEDIDDEEI